MNSASYEYRTMSARTDTQFVPRGIPVNCWKTFHANTTKILSTRNSSIIECTCSSNQSVPLQKKVPRDICISDFHFFLRMKEFLIIVASLLLSFR